VPHNHNHNHNHEHDHDHGNHGHHHDQGWRGIVRYLRQGRRMWDSDVNRAVVEAADPMPGETMVDIGAGFGPAAMVAVNRGAKVVAVDPTPSMRRMLALRRFVRRARHDIEIVDGAAEELPMGDGSVDVVITVNTMHHWSDPSLAVSEIARVTREGGRVVLVDEIFDDPTHPRFDPDEDWQHHHQHDFIDIDPTELAGQLAAAGFVETVGDRRRMGGAPVKFVSGRRPTPPEIGDESLTP
jgi:SAM-dependent methyltransferase